MNRRKFLKATGLTALSLAMPGCFSKNKKYAADDKQPNILFIMSDDHAAKGISAYHSLLSDVAKTPNIDRIAKEGMLFENCFCSNSICVPSRATILTGKYGHKNGCPTLSDEFDGSQQTFPKLLQKAGYYTSVIGKWHLSTEPTGFDYYNVLPGQGNYFNPTFREKGYPWTDDGRLIKKGYVTDIITDIALNCLKNRPKEKPFCMLLHHKAAHDLWEYDEKYAHLSDDIDLPEPPNLFDDYKTRTALANNKVFKLTEGLNNELAEVHKTGKNDRRTVYQLFVKSFLRCVASIDDNVARVLDYIDKEGLAANTIVIYTSDQGAFLGEHGLWDKRYMYEESIRMPFLVRYPSEVKPASVNDDIILNLDFAETFLDFAGVPIPNDMQGESIRPLLRGNSPEDWRTSMYYHYTDGGIPNHYGIRTRRYKLIFFYGLEWDWQTGEVRKVSKPEWELFDLKKDPNEMKNIYNDPAYANIVKDLKTQLRQLKEKFEDNDENYPGLKEVAQKYW